MSSQQPMQIPSLSDPCQRLIDQFDNLVADELEEEEFWVSVREFEERLRSYPEEVAAKLGIKRNISEINDIFDKTFVLRRDRKEAELSGLSERERELYVNIMKNYRNLIYKVAELRDRALSIEDQKLSDIGLGWAVSFLTRYYQVITAAGSLEDIVNLMEAQLASMNEAMIKGSFTRQKTKLNLIAPVIKHLNSVNRGFPDDLRQRLSSIDTCVGELLGLYGQNIDLNEKAGRILDLYRKIKEELWDLYEDTVKRSVVG